MEDKNKNSNGDSTYLFGAIFAITVVFLSFMLGVNGGKNAVDAANKSKEDGKDIVKQYEAIILGTEAIGGNTSVDYNTYFELKDGSILRIDDDNVYTYAKFNEGKEVKVEVTEGKTETKVKDINGNVMYEEVKEENSEKAKKSKELKPKVYVDKYKYISDVLVDGKSVRFVE